MKLDKTKFRFKIGDTIICENKIGKIVGYYFPINFNNFDNSFGYGYTVEIEGGTHHGTGYTYDEEGNAICTKNPAVYVAEKGVTRVFQPEFLNAKPGDKVKVKKRKDTGDSYAFYFTNEMAALENSVLIIKEIYLDNRPNYKYPSSFKIILKEKEFQWASSMLELISEKEESKEESKESILSLRSCIKTVKKLVLGDESEIDSNIKIKKAKPNLTFNI